MHEVWKQQLLGTGLQGAITSKNTFILSQCKPGTSPGEEHIPWGTPQVHEARFRREFGKQISSTSQAVGLSYQHTPLLTIKLHLVGEEIEAVVDTVASVSVVAKRLTCKLGIWKGARKVRVRQRDGSDLEGNLVVKATFKIMDSASVLGKFAIDAEVLDIGNGDVIFRLS